MNLKYIFNRIKFNNMALRDQNRHKNRITRMANSIEGRFPEVNRPEKIKLKHVKWIIDHWFNEQTYRPLTRDAYVASLRLLVEALGRGNHWIHALGIGPKGPGGRPRIVGVVKNKKNVIKK